jgi:predicted RecA/RadA family phage recombinase
MSALTRDRATSYREGIEIEFPVAAATKIYAGSMVCTNAGGFAAPAADVIGFRFVGVAMEQADNSAGADGAETVRLRRVGVFDFDAAALTQARVGDPVYAVDDHTAADTTGVTNHIKVGTLAKFVSATEGWIDIAR